MHSLLPIIGSVLRFVLTVPSALATNVETLGSGAPGIDEMWSMMKETFPHTDVGADGLSFVALRITDIILRTIGGLAVAMIMYGGIKMIAQSEEGFGEAKKIVLYAVMGLILAIVADAVVIYAQVLINAASA